MAVRYPFNTPPVSPRSTRPASCSGGRVSLRCPGGHRPVTGADMATLPARPTSVGRVLPRYIARLLNALLELTMFDLMVTYEWKPGIAPARVEHHLRLIRALVGKVPGLVAIRVGPRTFGFGPGSDGWSHACVMTFRGQADYAAFGASPAHDEIAPALVADLERISAIGFES